MVNKNKRDIFAEMRKYPKNNPKKCIIVAVFLFLALLGLILSRGVKINYNLSDYLSKDTETSIALDIMTDEFGMTGNVQVMLSGIDKDTANNVKKTLSDIEGVLTVSFDAESENSYKDENALFTLLIDGEDHSDTAKAVIAEIKTILGEKYGTVELGGSTIEYNALRENTGKEMGFIIVLSISLAAVLLLITASSWVEPVILLACSGIAIAINMGLNIFIGEISYITNSVSSILQLALSVDYSIIVLHTYRDEKKRRNDNTEAMREAVKAVLSPVSASALTTMAGLVALLFMSFTIGFDIGIVLIKGIVVSAITAMTFLPVVVLMLDSLIKKTEKKPFVPAGKFFSGFAFKANKVVAPLALIFIIAGAVLQGFNSYGFTDSIGSNKNIEEIFGRNDSIVLVYGTGDGEKDAEKELLLKELLLKYKNEKGENPLTSYVSTSTTVREMYDVEKAIKTLGLAEGDVKMLLAMYNIYNSDNVLSLTPYDFVRYANELLKSGDPDVSGMTDKNMKESISLLNSVADIVSNEYDAKSLYNLISSMLTTAKIDAKITQFAIDQMYGLYFYDSIPDSAKRLNTKDFALYISNNTKNLSDDTYQQSLYSVYFLAINRQAPADESLTYTEFYNKYMGNFGNMGITSELIQQTFILYNIGNGTKVNGLPITQNKISGYDFVAFLKNVAKTNSAVSERIDPDTIDKLYSACDTLTEAAPVSYSAMADKMNALSVMFTNEGETPKTIDSEKISGVYIKYAIADNTEAALAPVMATSLVDFIINNMNTNSLLSGKMTEEHKAKLEDAKALISSAGELFVADNYSRVLIGARLPAEGPEMVAFIDYLLYSVDEVFGDDAYITGKVVSTYDLQAAFDVDNLIITVFTIISIFLVILFIFKSLSLPVILVLVIQGAVWISLSLCLIGGGLVFFMSYIVTTCILMGATVDYGILMSNNYLVYRKTEDKSTALAKAVDSAMPTVFTSGLILVVCGFVISLISSQNSISSVGSLLAQGTIVSIIMITLGLPSILFLLDKYILKLTMNDKQTARLNAFTLKYINIFVSSKPCQAVIKFTTNLIGKVSKFVKPCLTRASEFIKSFAAKASRALKPFAKEVSGFIKFCAVSIAKLVKTAWDKLSFKLGFGKKKREAMLAEQRKREIQEKRRRTIEAKKRAIEEALAKGEPIPVTKKSPGRKPRKAPLTPEEAKAILDKKAAEQEEKKQQRAKRAAEKAALLKETASSQKEEDNSSK